MSDAELAVEGEFPDLGGASAWLNSEPLTPARLRGKVVVVQFCTYSCVNWLRTLPYVRAWAQKYRDRGLVVVGAHSPEFPFEHDVEKARPALEAMGVDYPIAMDNEFAVWRAFENNAWPALYFIDAEGRIRHHHLGEEDYERSERVIQQLLAEGGSNDLDSELVTPEISAIEAPADWETLGSPETYVGYERAERFVSPDRMLPDQRRTYVDAQELDLNEWSLSGDWTVGRQATVMNEPDGAITYRFHARDVNLVLALRNRVTRCGFACRSTEHRRPRLTGATSTTRAMAPSSSPGSISLSVSRAVPATAPSRSRSSIPAPTHTSSRSDSSTS
jgi:thiol-disulfide isomerase/thioredoxin